uniref:Mannose-P-dolichol utilization defect 1 protein homolog n=1 Tax=Calcidiscus leptoporus TaxID=127549 RepID=A0A7S0NTS5_9EUKA|eukprot:CAMPEP_0119366848 /NCGR_PEP_ID=MMETSP1334-20130426/13672_1 /TAXON_ID=127549 /ORGANISM="Calcidiscus leptoporus, Strain RCC1130" /LENGTH=262 /DNA_ID=CAMNT_0007383141 /DNA_START=15 /DNA_END=803 /DNA_ORIENTATION=-
MPSLESCAQLYYPSGSYFVPDAHAIFDLPCLKLVVSKVLGYGIVAGSAMVKLPQVAKIARAGNVDGLSSSSIALELTATIASFSYFAPLGYAFSTWGENLFLLVQNVLIYALHSHYTSGLGPSFALGAAAYTAFGSVLFFRLLPSLDVPQAVCSGVGLSRCRVTCADVAGSLPILLSLGSRLPQIMQNMRQGHTGQLALATYLLTTLGGCARIFTTMQEIDDPLTLAQALLNFLQNAALLLQIVLFGSAARPAKQAMDSKNL